MIQEFVMIEAIQAVVETMHNPQAFSPRTALFHRYQIFRAVEGAVFPVRTAVQNGSGKNRPLRMSS